MADWDKVKKGYDRGMTDAELAEAFDIKKATIRVHRNRNGWGTANKAKTVYKKKRVTKENVTERNVTKKRNVTKEKRNTLQIRSEIESAQGLTDRERLFCQQYIIKHNAVQTYINVFDSTYEEANKNAYRIMGKAGVKKYLDDLKKRQEDKLRFTADDLMSKWVRDLNADIGDYIDFRTVEVQRMDENGNPMSDAHGNPIHDYQSEVWLKDKSKMDLSVVQKLHKGKDGVVVELPDKFRIAKELIDRLPSSTSHEEKESTFMKALKQSDKQFGDEMPDFDLKHANPVEDDEYEH